MREGKVEGEWVRDVKEERGGSKVRLPEGRGWQQKGKGGHFGAISI